MFKTKIGRAELLKQEYIPDVLNRIFFTLSYFTLGSDISTTSRLKQTNRMAYGLWQSRSIIYIMYLKKA